MVPGQDAEMERRIMESHRRLVGQTPAEADLNLLETARRCELYGMKMHPAKVGSGAGGGGQMVTAADCRRKSLLSLRCVGDNGAGCIRSREI